MFSILHYHPKFKSMPELSLSLERTKKAYRIAVGCLFFLQGLCFSSWASRIPSIQQSLHLSNAALGAVLLALPVGSLAGLPFSGWLVTRFGSKRIATNALLLYSFLLILIGTAQTVPLLVASLILFGMAGNISNIAINTQAVGVEAKYGRNIMASFHGMWSLAGFAGAGIGAFMIGQSLLPFHHFIIITALILCGLAFSFPYMLPNEVKAAASSRLFVKPDGMLMKLGIIAFFCMICEGAMFDWSGIYFQHVVKADPNWIGAGFTTFMLTMATGRFLADRVVHVYGFTRTIQLSGLLIATGLAIAVIFPSLPMALFGFFIVGFGISSGVPLVYSEAGKSGTVAAGNALAAVSSIGFLGFLAGPPLIGMVAGIFSLRISFMIIGIIGILIILIAAQKRKASL
jgi:MFS family permease